eukprot:361682-Chlamydomonas_euryale.AAC.2
MWSWWPEAHVLICSGGVERSPLLCAALCVPFPQRHDREWSGRDHRQGRGAGARAAQAPGTPHRGAAAAPARAQREVWLQHLRRGRRVRDNGAGLPAVQAWQGRGEVDRAKEVRSRRVCSDRARERTCLGCGPSQCGPAALSQCGPAGLSQCGPAGPSQCGPAGPSQCGRCRGDEHGTCVWGCANAYFLDLEIRSIRRSYVAMPYFRIFEGRSFRVLGAGMVRFWQEGYRWKALHT